MKRLLLIFCCALPLAAEESAGQRDMTPWMWANFIILVAGLGYLTKKYAGPFLKARTEGIGKGIAEAQKMKADADARVAQVNAQLANLDTEIATLRDEMQKEQAREAERLAARHKAEFARIQEQAAQELESSAKAARLELQQHAARLALDLAEHKIRARMNPETQQRLTSEFVNSLS